MGNNSGSFLGRIEALEADITGLVGALEAVTQVLRKAQVNEQGTLELVRELQQRLSRLEKREVPPYTQLQCAYCNEMCENLIALSAHCATAHPTEPVAGGTPDRFKLY